MPDFPHSYRDVANREIGLLGKFTDANRLQFVLKYGPSTALESANKTVSLADVDPKFLPVVTGGAYDMLSIEVRRGKGDRNWIVTVEPKREEQPIAFSAVGTVGGTGRLMNVSCFDTNLLSAGENVIARGKVSFHGKPKELTDSSACFTKPGMAIEQAFSKFDAFLQLLVRGKDVEAAKGTQR